MEAETHRDDCPADLIPTRDSLLSRLKDWEANESWRDFFETYWWLIYGSALQRGLSHHETQELVQETVVAVAKHIGKFKYDPEVCAFKPWLLAVTRSKIAKQIERRARQPATVNGAPKDSSGTGRIERIPDQQTRPWEQFWDAEWERNLMDAAIRRVKSRVTIEQYQMLDLFVFKQWPARDVARTLKVNRFAAGVVRTRLGPAGKLLQVLVAGHQDLHTDPWILLCVWEADEHIISPIAFCMPRIGWKRGLSKARPWYDDDLY